MKVRELATLALSFVLLTAAGSADAAAPLSGRATWAVDAAKGWMESGMRGELPLPDAMRQAFVNLPEPGVAQAPGAEPGLRLLVVTDNPQALRDAGITVRTVAGQVVTATVPLSLVDRLESIPGVQLVELPHLLQPSLDVSLLDVNADQVHGADQPPYAGITGAGVVVGVVDTGLDYSHPDFQNTDGTTRIKGIWDQTDAGGPTAVGFGYGTEWTEASINSGTARERDNDGHGTHVTGIAAGNGRSNAYTFVGVAPEADILFVKTDFLEDSIIDAVSWIQTRAGIAPAVVNMSLGSQFGPHDGTSCLDLAMNGLSGPGRIIVAACGNDRGLDIHSEALINNSGGSQQLDMVIDSYSPNAGSNNDLLFIDGWYPGGVSFSVSVFSPTNIQTGPVTPNSITSQVTADGTVRIEQFIGGNGDHGMLIDIWDSNGVAPRAGTWRVVVTNNDLTNEEIDFWISFNRLGGGPRVFWNTFAENAELVTTPASADSVLSVAAYVTKTIWPTFGGGQCSYGQNPPGLGTIAPFSSPGPLRDDTLKPEISTPGMGIGSALSADAGNTTFTQGCARTPDNMHAISQGTSQASPHVAGAVALMLQADPSLSKKDATNRITASARQDIQTGGGFSTDYGWGRLDADAAVRSITPVRLLSLTAAWEDGKPVIRWELAETEPGTRFWVERGASEEGDYARVSNYLDGVGPFAWNDPNPVDSESYYRVMSLGRDGSLEPFGPVHLDPMTQELRVWQNAPNPFSSSTIIAFQLDRPRAVQVDVIDVKGRRIRTMELGILNEGRHTAVWDGTESGGRPAAAGIYFYRVQAEESVFVRRMVLTR